MEGHVVAAETEKVAQADVDAVFAFLAAKALEKRRPSSLSASHRTVETKRALVLVYAIAAKRNFGRAVA